MALPVGTTSRSLHRLAGVLLAAFLCLGMISWWWSGLANWGAMTAGLLVLWGLWMLAQLAADVHTVPGQPMHWVLLVVCILLALPLNALHWRFTEGEPAGSMSICFIIELALLALGMTLTQALLGRVSRKSMLCGVVGLSMIGGALLGLYVRSSQQPGAWSLMLLAIAGCLVWLSSMLLAGAELRAAGIRTMPLVRAAGFLAVAGVVSAAAYWLTVRRGGMSVSFDLSGRWLGNDAFGVMSMPPDALGIDYVCVLAGDAPALLMLLGPLVALGWLAWRGRRSGSLAVPVCWSLAAAFALAAFLGPAGPFAPAVLLGMIFVWGMGPSMLGAAKGQWTHGLIVLVALMGVLVLLGLSTDGNFIMWGAAAFNVSDKFLHAAGGLLLTLVLVWLWGGRRIRTGLLLVAGSILLGAGAEMVQLQFSWRFAQWQDFLLHAAGSASAGVLYLLAMASRWCESKYVTRSPQSIDAQDA